MLQLDSGKYTQTIFDAMHTYFSFLFIEKV